MRRAKQDPGLFIELLNLELLNGSKVQQFKVQSEGRKR
jgi:hypothetical protein